MSFNVENVKSLLHHVADFGGFQEVFTDNGVNAIQFLKPEDVGTARISIIKNSALNREFRDKYVGDLKYYKVLSIDVNGDNSYLIVAYPDPRKPHKFTTYATALLVNPGRNLRGPSLSWFEESYGRPLPLIMDIAGIIEIFGGALPVVLLGDRYQNNPQLYAQYMAKYGFKQRGYFVKLFYLEEFFLFLKIASALYGSALLFFGGLDDIIGLFKK